MMQTADVQSNLWTHTAPPGPETPALQGERTADVAIVGGGFTGLSTALHLAQQGTDVRLVEAGEPGFGASGRNNGQVIPAYGRHNPDDVVREFGKEAGERLNQWVAGSADLVFDLIRQHEIDCDASQEGWLQPAHAASRLAGIRSKYEQWAARGAPVDWLDGEASRHLTGSAYYRHGAWLHRSGGHIQPLSYARGLARAAIAAGAHLHGNSPANAIESIGGKWRLTCPTGSITADNIVIATNGYERGIWPNLRRSIVPFRTFHAATAPLTDNVARTVLPSGHGLSDTRQALWAYRKDRFGRVVVTASPLTTFAARSAITRSTVERISTAFPQIERPEPEYIWEGTIAMTADRLPRFHELAGGAYAGLAYSGRGIAMATAMGKLLADRIMGTPASDLPVPASAVKPLPMHDLAAPLSRALLLLYRWRDKRA
jgi:glycine/D-amino acid oxidase-like deaminating enzyme